MECGSRIRRGISPRQMDCTKGGHRCVADVSRNPHFISSQHDHFAVCGLVRDQSDDPKCEFQEVPIGEKDEQIFSSDFVLPALCSLGNDTGTRRCVPRCEHWQLSVHRIGIVTINCRNGNDVGVPLVLLGLDVRLQSVGGK